MTVRGKNPDKSKPPDLTNSGVGGVQMADVSVDTETGIVRVNKMVAVQDCGLVVDVKTAESQVLGRAHHGHQLRAVRGEDSRSRDRAHAEPEHGVLSPRRASPTLASWRST